MPLEKQKEPSRIKRRLFLFSGTIPDDVPALLSQAEISHWITDLPSET